MAGNPGWKKGGTSPNPSGRPRGIVDRRMRLNKALGEGANVLIEVIKQKALDGDMQAAGLIMARLVPQLKAEDSLVQFEFDPKASMQAQIESVLTAVASGTMTLDQGKTFVTMIREYAEVKALDSEGDKADKLIDAFKQMAQAVPV